MNNKLNTTTPNHITYRYEDLSFEIIGGINSESYTTLRVMLIVIYKREKIREPLDLYNSSILTVFTRKVAEQTGLTIKYIETALKELTNQLETYKLNLIENSRTSTTPSYQLSEEERAEAEAFLKQADLLQRTNELIGKTVIGNEKNRLVLYLLYLSRKTDTPLHAMVEGKDNYLQFTISTLLPDEDKTTISHLTDNCLFYWQENQLQGKVLLAEDTEINTKQLNLLSDFQKKGSLTKTTVQKNEYGNLQTVQRTVEGGCVSIYTPNSSKYDRRRSIVLSEDESIEQQEKLIDYQKKVRAGKINRIEQQNTIQLLRNLQRLIQPMKVVNPFAEIVELPKNIQNKRFSYDQYLGFVEIITLYGQYQRDQKTDEQTGEFFIETTIEDIQLANELLLEILAEKCEVLSKPTQVYFDKIKSILSSTNSETFSTQEIYLWTGISKTSIKRNNALLIQEGCISYVEGSEKHSPRYQITVENMNENVQETIQKVLNESIHNIQTGSPSTTVVQTTNGLPNILNDSLKSEVDHKVDGVHPPAEPEKKSKQKTSPTNPIKQAS